MVLLDFFDHRPVAHTGTTIRLLNPLTLLDRLYPTYDAAPRRLYYVQLTTMVEASAAGAQLGGIDHWTCSHYITS